MLERLKKYNTIKLWKIEITIVPPKITIKL
jgi:hypothetical protein